MLSMHRSQKSLFLLALYILCSSLSLSAKSFSNYIGIANLINADPLFVGTSIEVGGHSNYDQGLGAKYTLGFISSEYDAEEAGYRFQPMNVYFGFQMTYSFKKQISQPIYAGMGLQFGVRKNEIVAEEGNTKFTGIKDVLDLYLDGVLLTAGYTTPRPYNINIELSGIFRMQRIFPLDNKDDVNSYGKMTFIKGGIFKISYYIPD